MSKHAFLSYSSKDVVFARALVKELEQRAEQSEELDLSIFFADKGLPTAHYGETLTTAIMKSDVFLLIMSKYSIGAVGTTADGSDDVLAEIQTAHTHRKLFIPLLIGDIDELTCHIRFQHLLAARPNHIDIKGCVNTGHYDRACEMILAAIKGVPAAPGAKERNALYEIEACLKKGHHAVALRALAAAAGSPQDAERIELLKVIAQLQHTPVHKLNKSTADALVERLNRLLDGSETPAVLYVLGALSVHFYTKFFMADVTGGMSELKAQARALPFAAAKYVIMMRHALPKDSRFELDWRL